MSDKDPVRFGGKEKCLIGVYFIATATSTILFTATLVIVIQSQNGAHESKTTDINATGHTEQQVSNIDQEIFKLNQEIGQIRSELEKRTAAGNAKIRKLQEEVDILREGKNLTEKHEEDNAALNDEVRKLHSDIVLLRVEDERHKNDTKRFEIDNAALKKEISKLQTNVALVQATNGDSSLCSVGVSYGGKVADYRISASSQFFAYPAHFGRLNKDGLSWIARENDGTPWIQVDFGSVKKIRGVMTQGSASRYEWVETYKLLCGEYEDVLPDLARNSKVYDGNSDQNTIVTHIFSSSKSCQYVRIYPQARYGYYFSLRMEWITECT